MGRTLNPQSEPAVIVRHRIVKPRLDDELTAHFVGVPAVVTHHLKALVCNLLRDRRDEIARREYLKVALDLRIHSRAIENRIARMIHLHLCHGERIANNILRESLYILTLVRRDAPTLMDLFR